MTETCIATAVTATELRVMVVDHSNYSRATAARAPGGVSAVQSAALLVRCAKQSGESFSSRTQPAMVTDPVLEYAVDTALSLR
jgi:hypothetical protein